MVVKGGYTVKGAKGWQVELGANGGNSVAGAKGDHGGMGMKGVAGYPTGMPFRECLFDPIIPFLTQTRIGSINIYLYLDSQQQLLEHCMTLYSALAKPKNRDNAW
jgi:hypothetical protein